MTKILDALTAAHTNTRAICTTNYRAGTGCDSCPIMVPCESPLDGRFSRETIDAHTAKVERAASLVLS